MVSLVVIIHGKIYNEIRDRRFFKMKYNRLGKTDMHVSELALGCMSLGTDITHARDIVQHAVKSGINFLDTADLYDFGLNEEMIGSIIKENRKDIILSTKVGNHFDTKSKDWYWDPSPAYIEEAVKDSLRRLQTDYIDLYMLHGGTIEDPIDEVIAAFEKLKKEGIIRAYGISSIRPNVIRQFVEKSTIDAVMMQYSLLDRRAEEEMLELLVANQISVLARGTIAKGLLSNQAAELIKKKASNGYLDYQFDELIEIHEKIISNPELAQPLLALSQQYALKHKAITSLVLGISSTKQLLEALEHYNNANLTDEAYQFLQAITKANKYLDHR